MKPLPPSPRWKLATAIIERLQSHPDLRDLVYGSIYCQESQTQALDLIRKQHKGMIVVGTGDMAAIDPLIGGAYRTRYGIVVAAWPGLAGSAQGTAAAERVDSLVDYVMALLNGYRTHSSAPWNNLACEGDEPFALILNKQEAPTYARIVHVAATVYSSESK